MCMKRPKYGAFFASIGFRSRFVQTSKSRPTCDSATGALTAPHATSRPGASVRRPPPAALILLHNGHDPFGARESRAPILIDGLGVVSIGVPPVECALVLVTEKARKGCISNDAPPVGMLAHRIKPFSVRVFILDLR